MTPLISIRVAVGTAMTLFGVLAPQASTAQTFELHAVRLCPELEEDPECDVGLEESNKFRDDVQEINLEFEAVGISFLPTGPELVRDNELAKLRRVKSAANTARIQTVMSQFVAPHPERITIFMMYPKSGCWNGLPCPTDKTAAAFDDEDAVFCGPPGNAGRSYAHELGHYFCLKHSHSKEDYPEDDPPILDFDAEVVCKVLGAITDTPADPSSLEPWNSKDGPDKVVPNDVPGGFVSGHTWCDEGLLPVVDYGSAHPDSCHPTCYVVSNGTPMEIPWMSPHVWNAMNYHRGCRGPYTLSGDTKRAFTQQQRENIGQCITDHPLRQQLVDVCASAGGDSDFDGWCDAGPDVTRDWCPDVRDSRNRDSDGDKVGNACDLCRFLKNDKFPGGIISDLDHDGLGDPCDPDRDNDGCVNEVDLHPDEAVLVHGEYDDHCSSGTHYIEQYEGGDLDGDTLVDCADFDDDGDGTFDWNDPCPIHEDPTVCTGDTYDDPLDWEPCHEIWEVACVFGDCNHLALQLDPGYPDPTHTWTFDTVEILDGALYVGKLAGHTASETLMALHGKLPGPDGRLPGEHLALTLVDKASGRVVARVADYAASEPRVAEGGWSGTLVRIEPGREGERLTAELVWTLATPPGGAAIDGDRDGVPDFFDVCTAMYDPAQQDQDDDGYGDLCDGDFAGDGLVADDDVALVASCLDVSVADDGMLGDDPADWREEDEEDEDDAPIVSADAIQRCVPADLDGNDLVDARDLELIRALYGRAPGPSARVMPERR